MKDETLAIIFILGLAFSFTAGYYSNNSVKDMQYKQVSDSKLYNPTFKVCRIEYGNDTGFFHADNSSRCQQMNPWNMEYQ